MRGKSRTKSESGIMSRIEYGIKSGIRAGIKTRLLAIWVLGILLADMCFGGAGMTVQAEEQDFIIDAVVLPQNQDTYDIRLTVQNNGADWEGTARLTIEPSYSLSSTAYDTVLSLPQGSTKQFTVKVPRNGQEVSRGIVKVALLDKKSHKSAEKEFNRLLQDMSDALSMGILSDAYSTLTYLDMGGGELYFSGDEYPIRLVEVNQDSLEDTLDELTFLVIDRYDTSVLTEEEVKAVKLWNYNGGVLIVGTGNYGEKTLAGLDYLELQCGKILKPGESADNVNTYVDFTQLHIAELKDLRGTYSDGVYDTSALVTSVGYGAASVLPYGLSELGERDASVYADYIHQENFVLYILDEACGQASSRYGVHSTSSSSSDSMYIMQRILRVLGNSSGSLNFGALRFIVILYVIFVGPVLYIILRLLKKRELYWVAVPVTAFFGIFLVFLAGRGFEVVSTRVYSVTVENLSDKRGGRTYLHCYDANHDEWNLRLAEDYEYVGPVTDSYHYDRDEDKYYNHIRREGDRLFFGIKPSSSFEDSYFCAGGSRSKETGSISLYSGSAQWGAGGTFSIGTVTNGTNQDFSYFAVLENDTIYVYKNLPAGEECKLQDAECIYNNLQSYRSNVGYGYLYDFLDDVMDDAKKKKSSREDVDALAALGVGIFSIYPRLNSSDVLIMGVATDWDKKVDDACSETSYGCLYVIQ